MTGVAKPLRASTRSKSARVIPGEASAGTGQAALWASSEILGQDLGQAAPGLGLPGRAVEIIASAATIDDAMDQLDAAGLLPSAEESCDELLSWFTPLLEPDCDQLDAELAGSAFLGAMRSAAPAELSEDELAAMLTELIAQVRPSRSPEIVAMCRVFAAIGPPGARTAAADAAKLLVSGGLADFSWAAGLGQPEPGRCFGYGDVYGEQVSVIMCFKYGRKAHAVAVLIDNVLGGGIKDCWVSDQSPESIRNRCRSAARDPEIKFLDLDGARARAIVAAALARQPCPVEPDQVEDVVENLDLLRARVALLPEPESAAMRESGTVGAATRPTRSSAGRKGAGKPGVAKSGVGKSGARGRTSAARTVHRIKVTLHGTRPPIWRRFEVPSDITLERLHGVIQIGFSWNGDHMWIFETPAGQYGVARSGLGFRNAAVKKLFAVAAERGDRIRYEYDFGDSWVHDIIVEDVGLAKAGVAYPRCAAGRLAAPPDDCGGVWGYYDLLESLADPDNDQHAERLEWLGLSDADEFDHELFDLDKINVALARIATVTALEVEDLHKSSTSPLNR